MDVLHVTTPDAEAPTTTAVLATVRQNHFIDPLAEEHVIEVAEPTVVGAFCRRQPSAK